MKTFLNRHRGWLLPTFLILFILEVITFPFVTGFTYAGRSENPDHVLTYTTNKLVWDSATGINEKGVAELSLFKTTYEGAESSNGDKIVAPGTEATAIIRLNNDSEGKVNFTAVLYEIKSNEALPVQVNFVENEHIADTTTYVLPSGVEEENVVRAVMGSVKANEILDLDIHWLWEFEASEEQDVIDTVLGNNAEDDITVGVYIVVEDLKPEAPKTGDNVMLSGYMTLMGISLVVLLLLMISKKREQKCKK